MRQHFAAGNATFTDDVIAEPNPLFWRDRKVFITGATGFLGAWLARALVQSGAKVVGLIRDRPQPNALELVGVAAKLTAIYGALEDESVIERALSDYEIEVVFHLAAQTLVGTAYRSPAITFDSNIRGTWNLLEACRKHADRLKAVVVASSDKAYGVHQQLPYSEEFPLQPRFPYDASKACAEILARTYFHTYNLPVAITRCANIYGGGDLNWSRVVPGTIRAALEGVRPVIRSDGSPVRDYLYVEDAVRAYLRIVERMDAGGVAGAAFNFGSNEPIAVLPLVERILRICECADLKPDVQGTARAEIDRQYLDSTKARRELGWEPHVSFDEGLRRSLAWYRDSGVIQVTARGQTV